MKLLNMGGRKAKTNELFIIIVRLLIIENCLLIWLSSILLLLMHCNSIPIYLSISTIQPIDI